VKKTLLICAALAFCGCSGGSSNSGGSGGGTQTPAAVAGKWDIISVSTQNPGASYPYAAIEANLSQTDTTVSAGAAATQVLPFYVQGGTFGVASENACGGTSETVSASVSGNNFTFTLTETGPNGTYNITGTATVSSDGTTMTGNYSAAAACGFSSDAGTFTGSLISSVSGTYSVNDGTGTNNTITVTEDGSHNLTVTGSSQGSSFTLTGEAIGGLMVLSGNVPGIGLTDYVAIYLTPQLVTLVPTINGVATTAGQFVIFGSDGSIGLATKQQ